MRGLHKAGNPREIRSLRQAGSSRAYVKQDLCRRGCALKNEGPYIKQKLLERKKVFIKQGVPGPMRTGDSLLCNGIGRLDKSLLFNDFWRSVASPPAIELCLMRTGDSLLCKGILRLDKPLLFNDFWRSVASPPATEVWFRCAPPHVASLINGNGVQERRALPVFASRKVFVFQWLMVF